MDAVWQADTDNNLSERDWIISVFMEMLITCVIFSHTHWLKLSANAITHADQTHTCCYTTDE